MSKFKRSVLIMTISYGHVIKYGVKFETKKEAIERVYKALLDKTDPLNFIVLEYGYIGGCCGGYGECYYNLHVVDGKLYYTQGDRNRAFAEAFTGDRWEAEDVLEAVEARIVKELADYHARKEAAAR
jgi:hypothetical protein